MLIRWKIRKSSYGVKGMSFKTFLSLVILIVFGFVVVGVLVVRAREVDEIVLREM